MRLKSRLERIEAQKSPEKSPGVILKLVGHEPWDPHWARPATAGGEREMITRSADESIEQFMERARQAYPATVSVLVGNRERG